MKEALSKRLILRRLVNASQLKAGNADTPRALKHPPVEMAAHRCPYNVSHYKKMGGWSWVRDDFLMRQRRRTRQESEQPFTKGMTTAAEMQKTQQHLFFYFLFPIL